MKTFTYTTLTGAVLTYRRLALGTADLIKSAVMREMFPDRPAPPEQVVETASGPQTIVNETHPDHIAAVEKWDEAVERESRKRLVRIITDYGLAPTTVDEEAVAAHRAAHAAVGVDFPDSDRDLYIWSIACPDQSDINTLMGNVLGLDALQEAIGRARQAFRGAVSGAEHLEPEATAK